MVELIDQEKLNFFKRFEEVEEASDMIREIPQSSDQDLDVSLDSCESEMSYEIVQSEIPILSIQ